MAAYGDDLVVWGIASRETEERVRAWAEYHDVEMPLLLDLDGTVNGDYRMQMAFPTGAYPQEWLIGADGTIAYLNNRYEYSKLVTAIEAALAD